MSMQFIDGTGTAKRYAALGDGSIDSPYVPLRANAFKGLTDQVVGIFGEGLVGMKSPTVSVKFTSNQLNQSFDVELPALTGDGARGVTNATAFVSSASSGMAQISSLDQVRYVPGETLFMLFTASFLGSSGFGYAGGFDSAYQDGFVLKRNNSTGELSFGYLDAGTERGSGGVAGFDIVDTSVINGFNPAKINIWMIMAGFLGVASPVLCCIKDRKIHLVHICNTEGLLDDVHVKQPTFPISIKAENGGQVKTGSFEGGLFNQLDNYPNDRTFSFPHRPLSNSTNPLGSFQMPASTDVQTVAAFRSKTTFNGVPNRARSLLKKFEVTVQYEGASDGYVQFMLVSNPSFSVLPTYQDIDTTNSVIEWDSYDDTDNTPITAQYDVVAGQGNVLPLATVHYSGTNQGGIAVGTQNIDAESLKAFLRPGQEIVLIARNSSAVALECLFHFTWVEEQ